MACKHFEDGSDYPIQGSWTDNASGEPADRPWKRRAVFYELGSYSQVCYHHMTEDSDPRRQAPSPTDPTPEEQELRSLMHLPYRSWCKISLRSKARGVYHNEQCDRRPRLQADLGFLIGEDTRQASLVESLPGWPGPVTFHRTVSGTTHLLNYGISRLSAAVPQGVLQTDQEASMRGLARGGSYAGFSVRLPPA